MLHSWLALIAVALILNAFLLAFIAIRLSKKSKNNPYGISFDQLLDQLPGNIFWKDKNGVLIAGNREHSRIFSNQDRFSGVTAYDLFPKEHADRIHQNDLEVMREGKLRIEEEYGETPLGEIKTYLSYKAPLRDTKGNIIGVIGNSIDITMAKKAEMARLEMLENVIALMPGYVYWLGKDGAFLGCNDNEAKLLSLASRKDIVGKTNQALLANPYPDVSAQQLDELNAQVMASGKDVLFEEEALSAEGKRTAFWSHKAPIKNEAGEVIGMVGISIDITQLKDADKQLKIAKEAAEKANKAKSEFVAVVSHEFRTPLTGVLGVVDILLGEGAITEEKRKEYLRNIRLASRYSLTLINNILDFSKLEANKLQPLHVAFSLREVIDDVFQMLGTQAAQKNLPLFLHYASDLPTKFIGDPQALTQVLVNIVGNAVKFTEAGKVDVTVLMKAMGSDQMAVEISVEDTGIGIPQDKLKSIFEEFEQVGASYSRNYSGTGLGLAVSKRLMGVLEGDVTVESEVNRGTKFGLHFALDVPGVSGVAALPLAAKGEACRILLVEDDPLVQFVHKHKLEKMGYTVLLAKDGASALSLFDTDKFDFIFMDIGLPDMSGNEVIHWMRKIELALGKHVPIVALTAYSDQESLNKVTAAGADAVLCKPVENAALREIIERYLPRHSGEK